MRGFSRNVALSILDKINLYTVGRIIVHYTRIDIIDKSYAEKDGERWAVYPFNKNNTTLYYEYTDNFVPEEIEGYTHKIVEVTKPSPLMVRDLNSMLVRSYQWYVAEANRPLTKEEEKAGVVNPPKLNFELVFSEVEFHGENAHLYAEYKKVIGIK